jgi:hypothetical protein
MNIKYNVDEHRERRENLITETNRIWILTWFKFITGGIGTYSKLEFRKREICFAKIFIVISVHSRDRLLFYVFGWRRLKIDFKFFLGINRNIFWLI